MNSRTLDSGNSSNNLPSLSPNEKRVFKYALSPSLQHFSCVALAKDLWTQEDIRTLMLDLFCVPENRKDLVQIGSKSEIYQYVEERVLAQGDKLKSLLSPAYRIQFWKMMCNNIKGMGREILKWIHYHDEYITNTDRNSDVTYRATNCLEYIIWSSFGRIDAVRTVRNLFANEKLDDVCKYRLACIYCLESDIQVYGEKVRVLQSTSNRKNSFLMKFWNSKVSSDFRCTKSSRGNRVQANTNEVIFCNAIKDNNAAAVKYSWNKLNDEEKSKNLKAYAKDWKDVNIACFLLSRANLEDQEHVLKECAGNILPLLLEDWLFMTFYMDTLKTLWDVVSNDMFYFLLLTLGSKFVDDISDYDGYLCLFQQMWTNCPEHLRAYMSPNESDCIRFLNGIFRFLSFPNDLDMLRQLLSVADAEQLKEIVHHESAMDKWEGLLKNEKWDILDEVIQISLLSTEEIRNFKKDLVEKDPCSVALHLLVHRTLNEVEQFLQWAFHSDEEKEQYIQVELAYKGFPNLLKNINFNEPCPFSKLDDFMMYCLKSEDKIRFFKSQDYVKNCFSYSVCELILEDNQGFVDLLLEWISWKKSTLVIFKHVFIARNADLLAFAVTKFGGFKAIEKMLRWCFNDQQIVNEFKKTSWEMTNSTTEKIVLKLFMERKFKLIDDLVGWCSTGEMDPFKDYFLMRVTDGSYFSNKNSHRDIKLHIFFWLNSSKYSR